MLKVQFIAFGAASSVYVVREVDWPGGDPGLRSQELEAVIENVLDGEWPPEAAGFRVLDELGRQIFPPSGATNDLPR